MYLRYNCCRFAIIHNNNKHQFSVMEFDLFHGWRKSRTKTEMVPKPNLLVFSLSNLDLWDPWNPVCNTLNLPNFRAKVLFWLISYTKTPETRNVGSRNMTVWGLGGYVFLVLKYENDSREIWRDEIAWEGGENVWATWPISDPGRSGQAAKGVSLFCNIYAQQMPTKKKWVLIN